MSGESERAIIHVDMDAFYASVEQRDNPELRGKPVIVGGAGRRGVVAAASYEVREFGVHSAMPIVRARRLCPQAIIVPPRGGHYTAVSRQVFEIFNRFTPVVEPLSLDEAFLDVTGSRKLLGEARDIGAEIRRLIREELRLPASVGIAPNKFLAKLASDEAKPDGLLVVEANAVQSFLDPLPVRRMWGVGPKAGSRLAALGVHTIGDLRRTPADRLTAVLGSQGQHFLRLAQGGDFREVESARADKSVSHETTFDVDLNALRDCQTQLLRLGDDVGKRLRRKGIKGKTVFIKVRTTQFKTFNRQRSLGQPSASDQAIVEVAWDLMAAWWAEHGPADIRLLGVGVKGLVVEQEEELLEQSRGDRLDQLKDQVADRFSGAGLKPASLVRKKDRER
ncbi:MAG: DNA polymerase IV [Xanthomonadales bacterium]|nr:DNA polymerase IV [Xanthomonadales bacterium]